jgi:SAM-dependent methyltransferase
VISATVTGGRVVASAEPGVGKVGTETAVPLRRCQGSRASLLVDRRCDHPGVAVVTGVAGQRVSSTILRLLGGYPCSRKNLGFRNPPSPKRNLKQVVGRFVKSAVPVNFRIRYSAWRRALSQRHNRSRSTEEVFTSVYQQSLWGGVDGEFCSGSGSSDEEVVSPYVAMIARLARDEGFEGSSFVDLGCGDFRVGSQLVHLSNRYVGVDVVKPLVESLRHRFAVDGLSFEHLDIINDPLPSGDVCMLRQVLQHLSNEQIKSILPKLKQFRWVIITEHYPGDGVPVRPNLDKTHGGDIRLYRQSGVYLDSPPFNIPVDKLREVLSVQGAGCDPATDPGVIRSFLYCPHPAEASF